MEKISEILNNIKDRISNPFIFSFISSWVIINWPITVGLIWYDPNQIEKKESTSIFKFIEDNINPTSAIWHPLLFAISYTLLIPIVKNLIRAFYTWTAKWGENWNLRILKGGKISIDKYIQLRADNEKRRLILEEVITKESSYEQQYNSINTELLSAKSNINELTKRLNSSEEYMNKSRDHTILNGSWENTFEIEGSQKSSEPVYIYDRKYYIVSPLGEREYTFDIKDLFYDIVSGNVFFVKELTPDQKKDRPKIEHYNINRLRFESIDLLVGTESGTTKISYRRK